MIKEIIAYINGDFAYQKYLKFHQKKHFMNCKVIDKKTFLQQREKNKWGKINRCC
jgi:hypothetical protein